MLFLFPLTHYTVTGNGKQEIALIVNDNSPLPSEMTSKDIKNIYLGVKEHEKGVNIIPVDQKDKEIFEEFLAKFIGMSKTHYKSHWVSKLFGEGANPPKSVEGPENIVKSVSQNIGGIGYIWKNGLTGNEKGIRTVKVSQ